MRQKIPENAKAPVRASQLPRFCSGLMLYSKLLTMQNFAIGGYVMMKVAIGAMVVVLTGLMLSSCANTIRGAGRDTANAAHATKHAVEDVTN
jgi:predicted small secreted protein